MKTIYIIGIGGRTGAMFARELQGSVKIIGVCNARDSDSIRAGRMKIRRGGSDAEPCRSDTVQPEEFGAALSEHYPDYILLSVRNPVGEAVESYYRHFAGMNRIPALMLSQNGLSAADDAKAALVRALGSDAGKVRIIRVSLINGIDLKEEGGSADSSSVISYKLPVRLGFGDLSGQDDQELEKIFLQAGIAYQNFSGRVTEMENAKLFTNLIGMSAAVNGMSVSGGLHDRRVFKEEIAALREFAVCVKRSGGSFAADFCGYPVKAMARIITWPVWLLIPFRALFSNVVAKGRNRPKDLSEADYYNGEVVKLGRKVNAATPVNERIVAGSNARVFFKH